MNRRGISSLLLMIVALVPLALVIDLALLLVSFPNALRYVAAVDVVVFMAISVAALLSRMRKVPSVKEMVVPPTTALDKLRERNGGQRAPGATRETFPVDEVEAEEAGVFLGETEGEKSAREVDQILQRTRAKEMDLGVAPVQGIESRAQPIVAEPEPSAKEQTAVQKKILKSNGKIKDYSLSPDKLKVPAFICRCGHPHRFVCLTCGMSVEVAVKKSKTHWVEWAPEMGASP